MRGEFKLFLGFGCNTIFPRQPGYLLPGASNPFLAQGVGYLGTSVDPLAFLMDTANLLYQGFVGLIETTFSTIQPAVKTASGY